MLDGKVPAQKLLSCAYRTGQRFGAMHLIDVLIGRLTEKVTQFGHDKLSVFGIGRDLNEKQWRAVIRQLVAMGHLRADSEAFGALKLTESARGVLKGETEVMLREAAPGTRVRESRAKSRRGDLAPRAETRPADDRPAGRAAAPGAPTSRVSAACRPMWCCTIPPSTASPPRGPSTLDALRGIAGHRRQEAGALRRRVDRAGEGGGYVRMRPRLPLPFFTQAGTVARMSACDMREHRPRIASAYAR